MTTDRAGRVTGDEHGRRYGYDLAGRLASATTASGATTTYEYDDYGRLATETGPDGRRRFRYHASGQLRAVEADDGSTTRFAYDDAGRRTRTEHADGRTTTYAWDPLGQLRAVTTTDPDRATTTRHLTRNALGQVLAIDDTPIGWDDAITGKVVRIGPDRYLRAGRWTRPATPGGTWTDGTTDDPWGREPDAGADQGAIRLGYRGELCVDGLVLMGDRVYDPDTRQFLSKDPLPPAPGTNGSMASPYTYAWCDPVNHIDPSGRQPVSIEEFDAWVDRNDTSRFTRAGQAMLDDPWGTLAMAGIVVVGTGLIVTGVGAPIGAGILIGAATTAAFGIATDDFNPREVALGGAFGAVPGGHTARGAFLLAGAENLTSQIVIDGRGLDEISAGEMLFAGTLGAVIPVGLDQLGRHVPTGTATDIQPPGGTVPDRVPTGGGAPGGNPTTPPPDGYANWGGEYFDDGHRMVDQPFAPSVPGTALELHPFATGASSLTTARVRLRVCRFTAPFEPQRDVRRPPRPDRCAARAGHQPLRDRGGLGARRGRAIGRDQHRANRHSRPVRPEPAAARPEDGERVPPPGDRPDDR